LAKRRKAALERSRQALVDQDFHLPKRASTAALASSSAATASSRVTPGNCSRKSSRESPPPEIQQILKWHGRTAENRLSPENFGVLDDHAVIAAGHENSDGPIISPQSAHSHIFGTLITERHSTNEPDRGPSPPASKR
jgi:hypothetical protein